jgi:hypothetical protein
MLEALMPYGIAYMVASYGLLFVGFLVALIMNVRGS